MQYFCRVMPVEEESTGLVCGNFSHQNPVFEKLVKQMPQVIVLRASEGGPGNQIVDLILEEARSSNQQSNVLLNRLADCLFFILARTHLDIENGVFVAFTHPNLSAAMELIHQQSGLRLSLDQLANSAAMSRQSPMDYLTQWRMSQAYRWLADEGISTFDAATRCGYESEASFAKAFKRVMGVGPGSVRAQFAA